MKKLFFWILLLYYRIEYILLNFIIPHKKEESVVVVRSDAIGDSIIWLDTAKEFKKQYPNKHLVLIHNKAWIEIAQALPYFDETISFDRNQFLYKPAFRLSFLFALKKRKFEKIINPVYSRDYFCQDVFIHNLRGFEKIGYEGNYLNTTNVLQGFGEKLTKYTNRLKKKSDKWYTKLIPNDPSIEMELSRNAHFIRELFHVNFLSQLPAIPFDIPEFKHPSRKYIVLFVGASTPRKQWSFLKYRKLIRELVEDTIIVCGGKGEELIFENLIIDKPKDKNIVNLIGKTTLLELFAVIKDAQYIITNDTSASHITVAVRTPSVCLLGGAHFGRFQPYVVEQITEDQKKYIPKVAFNKMDCFGCNTHCIYSKDKNTIWPCIDTITVEQVLEKVDELKKELQN